MADKKRIAFVNQRYGEEVLGGSETYTRETAEALAKRDDFEVEVLTSKALDFKTWANHYDKDVETINGVTVRRYKTDKNRNRVVQRSLQILMNVFSITSPGLEEKRLKARGPYTPDLVEYIKEHKDEYDAFIFVTYMYYPTYFGAREVYDKAFFVPTAHNEEPIYMGIYKELFNNVKGIIYLTEEEKKFVNMQFKNSAVPSIVNGMGIRIPTTDDTPLETLKNDEKFPDKYIIFCGRIEENKGCKMLTDHVIRYNKDNEERIGLVLTGKSSMTIPEDENIKYLGFVSDEDKFKAMKGSFAICVPSAYESFSITLLEGMGCGKPALVNAKSEVLKGHIERSGAGETFETYEEFEKGVRKLLNEDINRELGSRAKQYVEDNYSPEHAAEAFAGFIKENIKEK